MIYLDNAASTFPKPPEVLAAVTDCLKNVGASPGRGQHKLALAAGRIVFNARRNVAKVLGAPSAADLIFTPNATESLNLAIKGWLRPGDSVVTTPLEHNSVYRPLAKLVEEQGVVMNIARCSSAGRVDKDDWRRKLVPGTRLAIVTHASNVLGAIQPLADLVEIAKSAGVPVLVDAAQSAGAIEIDIGSLGVGMLAFTGHKALFGPQGTGGLYIDPELDVAELISGGTGTASKGPQPSTRPERYESGTYNTPGLAGLGAGAGFVATIGVSRIFESEQNRIQRLMAALAEISGVALYGPPAGEARASLVSLNVRGISAHELAARLDNEYDICARSGWLCAPEAHRLIGTYDTGVLRLSPGYFSTDDEIDAAVAALGEISRALHRI